MEPNRSDNNSIDGRGLRQVMLEERKKVLDRGKFPHARLVVMAVRKR